RPTDPMPMIGKQAIGANSHPAGAQRLFDDSLEGQEVLVLLEKRSSADASIQNMIHHSAREMPRCVSHSCLLPTPPPLVKPKLAWTHISCLYLVDATFSSSGPSRK